MTYADDPLNDESPSEQIIDALTLDEAAAERLLDEPDSSAPPGYANVARLLAMAAAPALPEELAAEQAAVAAFLAVRPSVARPRRRHRWAASSLAGVVLLSGGVAAAATGTLPGPAQDAVAKTLDHVGINVPMRDGRPVSSSHGKGRSGAPDGKSGSGGSPRTETTGIDNGAGNHGTNRGGSGNHTGASQPPGQANGHTNSTGVDNGTGNGGTNQGGNGGNTGVTNPHPPPTQPPQAKDSSKAP
jgi:hypothetical protein